MTIIAAFKNAKINLFRIFIFVLNSNLTLKLPAFYIHIYHFLFSLSILSISFLIFLNHFSRLCRSLEECITVCDNGTLLYRPYQPMIQN